MGTDIPELLQLLVDGNDVRLRLLPANFLHHLTQDKALADTTLSGKNLDDVLADKRSNAFGILGARNKSRHFFLLTIDKIVQSNNFINHN